MTIPGAITIYGTISSCYKLSRSTVIFLGSRLSLLNTHSVSWYQPVSTYCFYWFWYFEELQGRHHIHLFKDELYKDYSRIKSTFFNRVVSSVLGGFNLTWLNYQKIVNQTDLIFHAYNHTNFDHELSVGKPYFRVLNHYPQQAPSTDKVLKLIYH